MSQQKVNLSEFSPQQLYQLRQGFQSQLATLSQSMGNFRYAQQKFEQGKRALKAAQDCKPNQQMLIPLSNALYVEGCLNNFNEDSGKRIYMVEIGAGFFVDLTANQGVEFYQRKINFVKEKTGKLQDLLNQKREQAKQVEMRIMSLMQQQQAQAQSQQPPKINQ